MKGINKMKDVSFSITFQYFMTLIFFIAVNIICVYNFVKNLKKVQLVFGNGMQMFWQSITKSISLTLAVGFFIFILLSSYFICDYSKDLPYAVRKNYVEATAVVIFIGAESDTGGGRKVTLRDLDTNEEIKIRTQDEKLEVGEIVKAYYLPNTKIGRLVRIETTEQNI